MSIEKVKRTVEVSGNIGRPCEHCNELVGVWKDDQDITKSINHYIEAHGYRLLHVGQQTTHGDKGDWHFTVAILGHDDPPALKPPVDADTGDEKLGWD